MSDDPKEPENYTLTEEVEKLLSIYIKEDKVDEHKDVAKINVSQTIGHVAFWYEKLRNAVDYQEEHLLRKNTIRRIIARKFNIPIPSTEKISISLLRELVRARYLTDTEFYQTTVDKIDEIIEKYSILRKEVILKHPNGESSKNNKILLDIIACEIEELLVSHDKEEALAGCMVLVMKRRFRTIEDEHNKLSDILIYIAVHRSLLKSDQASIRFQLFKRHFPHWLNLENEQEILNSWEKFLQMNKEIDGLLFDPLADKLQKIIKKKTAPFNILNLVIKHNIQTAEETILAPKSLSNIVENICQEQYSKTGSRVRRSVIQGIIYVFFTKMMLGILFELPYDLLTLGKIHTLPLAINLIFPPSFMFLITTGVKVPDWHNTEKILSEIKSIVYEEVKAKDTRIYSLNTAIKRTKTKSIFLSLLYILTFIITLGLPIWLLVQLNFNLISGILFFFFLSVVSFFGFRIRQNARGLFVLEEKENWTGIISDFIFMPFLKIGKWLALKFQGVNIFLIILDFIIEAPFKSVMEVIEDWVAFMKEKKEELT
ncbi:MAG: hypothetical protein ACD_58C00269G0004 [uncultured bacterium]|nr:MAG: hypothetical protein ACD_58C00269G0004 [uncultured bacterium]